MEQLEIAVKALDEKSATDIVVLDMKGLSPLFDYMVIASASNQRLAKSLVDNVIYRFEEGGYSIKGIEGEDGAWVLVDCKDIIINVFSNEERSHYDLEKLYLDVKRVDISKMLK